MNYSIIALDVDGTLLNDDYEITPVTKQALLQVHAAGVTIVLCTGRGPMNAIPILEELGLEGVLITHNGAATVQTPQRVVLHEYGFAVSELSRLVGFCREQRIHFDVSTAFGMYAEHIGVDEAHMYEKYMLLPESISDVLALQQPIVKFTMFGAPDVMDRVEQELPALNLSKRLQFIRSGTHFIDVMSEAASKGRALAQLADQLQVPREQIVAMGNYYNDVEMIQYAGLGIAMDNSPDAVKTAADAVTASNNEDGVAAALVKYGLVPS